MQKRAMARLVITSQSVLMASDAAVVGEMIAAASVMKVVNFMVMLCSTLLLLMSFDFPREVFKCWVGVMLER